MEGFFMSILSFKNVSKSFTEKGHQKINVLKNITLDFSDSGLVFIKGKSGSGKSTLLNLILNIEKVSSGEITFNSIPIESFSKGRLSFYRSKDIAIVFQHYNLIDKCSCLFNVMLPLIISGEKLNVAQAKATEMFGRFNLLSLLNKHDCELSGGEKQRIAIMRALINNPKIILCDEPTGALDSQNAESIMSILSEQSKKCLVIVVSHNDELVSKYADRIITLKDGMIESDSNSNVVFSLPKKENIKSKSNSKWKYYLVRRNFKSNFRKNLMCCFACLIGFTSSILAISFYNGSKEALRENQIKSLDYYTLSVQKKEYQEIEGSPLNLVKVSRPAKNEINFLTDFSSTLSCELNYDFILPQYCVVDCEGQKISDTKLTPVFSISLENYQKNLICQGSAPFNNDLNSAIVNCEFANEYFGNVDSILGKHLVIENKSKIDYPIFDNDRDYINDFVNLKLDFEIVAVVDEFSFLNQPKIYYSYTAFRDKMINTKLNQISDYLGRDFRCYDLVNESPSNSQISAYSYNIFLHNQEDVDKIFSLSKRLKSNESSLSLTSPMFDRIDAFESLVSTFSISMIVFVLIAIIGLAFIIGLFSFSNFIKNKKESAILSCLGAKSSDIGDIFVIENSFVALMSGLLSLLLSVPFAMLLNKLLFSHFGIVDVVRVNFGIVFGIPCFITLLITFMSLFLSFVSTELPLNVYKSMSLSNELRDE